MNACIFIIQVSFVRAMPSVYLDTWAPSHILLASFLNLERRGREQRWKLVLSCVIAKIIYNHNQLSELVWRGLLVFKYMIVACKEKGVS